MSHSRWTTILQNGLPLVAGGVVGIGLSEFLNFHWIRGTAVVLIGACLATIRFRGESPKSRPITSYDVKTATPRRILVMFLSSTRMDRNQPLIPGYITFTDDLESDLQNWAVAEMDGGANSRWNWAQPLRSIYHNSRNNGPLRQIVILGSNDSVLQIEMFVKRFVRRYDALKSLDVLVYLRDPQGGSDKTGVLRPVEQCPGGLKPAEGWSFDDFQEMTGALTSLFDCLTDGGHAKRSEIAVDITGGMKPTSVVAAVATVGSRIANQYVPTQPTLNEHKRPWYTPVQYDLFDDPYLD